MQFAGIEIKNLHEFEVKFPNENPEKKSLDNIRVTDLLNDFSKVFVCEKTQDKIEETAQSLFGYTTFDAIPLFEKINFNRKVKKWKSQFFVTDCINTLLQLIIIMMKCI